MKKILILLIIIFVFQIAVKAEYTFGPKEIDLMMESNEIRKVYGKVTCDYNVYVLENEKIFIARNFYEENAHCKWDKRLELEGYIPVHFTTQENREWTGTLLVPNK